MDRLLIQFTVGPMSHRDVLRWHASFQARAGTTWALHFDDAARFAAAELGGRTLPQPPPETALGALLGHITGGAEASDFQPMNVNFGLFPPIEKVKVKDGKRLKHTEQAVERKRAYTARAMADFDAWIGGSQRQAAE